MYPSFVALLYVPVAVWVVTGIGLVIAFRRSAPPLVLRLAATFLALWALLVTTTLIWVLYNGGWRAVTVLVRSPLLLFQPQFTLLWVEGGIGAFLVFVIAFCLNQLVGRGFLRLLSPRRLRWPKKLPRPRESTQLLAFRSLRPEAFSFTLLEVGKGRPWVHRVEFILLSETLLARLDATEVEAAIAHELGHIRGLDGRYLTFLRTLARMMRWDPLLAYLAYSLTRREECRADMEAVEMTRDPLALARTLYKISTWSDGQFPFGRTAFLGTGGVRGHRDAIARIQRLLDLAESGEFPEVAGG
ncbi:MAG: M48 family metalloprotease [Thermoplasmata archaeon]